MKPSRPVLCAVALLFVLVGCGPSAAERAAKERQRLELEAKSRREAEQANKAITDMNKKMFGKKPAPALSSEPEKKP